MTRQQSKNTNTSSVFISVPTDPLSGGNARFVFSFDNKVFKSEITAFLKKNNFDSFPRQYLESLEDQLHRLQIAFLRIAGQSIVSSIRLGGMMSGIAGYANKRPVFINLSGVDAGVRVFGSETGQLANSVRYDIDRNGNRTELVVSWGPAMTTPHVPGPYKEPASSENTEPFVLSNPLTLEYEADIINYEINKVAAIETGSPYQRRVANPAMKGFFPSSDRGFRVFEGASYKNYKALEKAYKAAVKDIFNKAAFSSEGENKKYTLKTFSEKFLANTVEAYYRQNVSGLNLVDTGDRLKSNEAAFFRNLKRIFPTNSRFTNNINNAEIKALFQIFKPGKRKSLSKSNIGISDSERMQSFERSLMRSLNEYFDSMGV